MAEYIDREKLIPDRCYYEPDGYEAVSCEQIFHEEVADVVEREKIDKAIKKIENIDLMSPFQDGINHYYKSREEIKAEAIKILKETIGEANKTESEEKNENM